MAAPPSGFSRKTPPLVDCEDLLATGILLKILTLILERLSLARGLGGEKAGSAAMVSHGILLDRLVPLILRQEGIGRLTRRRHPTVSPPNSQRRRGLVQADRNQFHRDQG